MAGQRLVSPEIEFGCDPEFFFEKDGVIIGAEKVLPKSGKIASTQMGGCEIVLDGVQAELHVQNSSCRANLSNYMQFAFKALRTHLSKMPEVKAVFKGVVELDQRTLEGLSEKSRILGCAPSLNRYDQEAIVGVDGATYMKRSAGGHIHLGLGAPADYRGKPNPMHAHRERLIPLLDILLGNTCVLIDRDPFAAERRKVYGRAGEYRLPAYGIEYRTLSNFWLRSYQLMSFVTGMARIAGSVLYTTIMDESAWMVRNYGKRKWDAEGKLLSLVDMEKVIFAINTNDLALAQENFDAIRPFIAEHGTAGYGTLSSTNLSAFDYFCKMVQEHGLEAWFSQDPLDHWCEKAEGHGSGWETFLSTTVSHAMKRAKREEKGLTKCQHCGRVRRNPNGHHCFCGNVWPCIYDTTPHPHIQTPNPIVNGAEINI